MEENTNPAQQPVQNPSPVVPPATSTPIPEAPKPKSKLLLIIAAIIILVLLAGGSSAAYFLVLNKPQENITTNQETSQISPSPTPDPTGDWKTYTSESFTFKYPNELTIPEEAIESKSEGLRISTPVEDEFLIIQTTSTEVVETGVNQTVEAKKEEAKNFGYYNSKYQGKSDIGGLEALIYTTDNPGGPAIPEDVVPPPYKGFIIYSDSQLNGKKAIKQLTIEYFARENYAKIFEQILSTFKFTENQSVDTSSPDLETIKMLISQRDNIPLDKLIITFDEQQKFGNNYASGSVSEKDAFGGGLWFAAKLNGEWVVVWTGNGLPLCADIAQYNLPEGFLSCY